MPNILGVNGLQTSTQQELVDYFIQQYQDIYGPDINLSSDTPDGQMMMIFIQAILDVQDLLTQVYNQFDPDNSYGKVLDQRVAINGIQRQAGTHTITNITIVTSQALNLYGLDQAIQEIYTVQDNAGNKWNLIESTVISGSGSHILVFQAEKPGAVLSSPNTITTPVTVVLGVVSVNNPTSYTTLGINEETDYQLKIRRQKSVSLSSQGYLDGLLAALKNIPGMASSYVYENDTGSTDGDGIPSHSIWVIVSGSSSPAAIANAIYTKRNAGCGMKGSETFNILQADGTIFIIRWDVVSTEDLFIKFNASSLDGVNPPNIQAIRDGLVNSFVPGVYEQVNINNLSTQVQDIDSNTLVTSAGFASTLGGSYTNTKTPSAKNKQFSVSSANIIILPILILPDEPTVESSATKQFAAYGGYGTYTWTIQTDSSGGASIDSNGLYTAGSGSGVDVIRATDGNSNHTDMNVTVV